MKKLFSLIITLVVMAGFTLTACQTTDPAQPQPTIQNDPIDLSAEEQEALQKQLQDLENLIAEQKQNNEVNHLKVIDLARTHEALGQFDEAIGVYEDYLAESETVETVMISNLAVLYKVAENYQGSINQYQRLVDEFGEVQHLNEVARLYVLLGDVEKAEQMYEQWKEKTGIEGDQLTEQIIQGAKAK